MNTTNSEREAEKTEQNIPKSVGDGGAKPTQKKSGDHDGHKGENRTPEGSGKVEIRRREERSQERRRNPTAQHDDGRSE